MDLAIAPSPGAPVTEYEDVKLTNIRKVIAKSMQQSLSTMAQLTHTSSFDATNILALRKQLKAAGEKMAVPNITLNDILLFAVSRVLPKHPDLNAHFLDDRIRRFKGVNLGVAVDTPRGLMVPTLFHADQKSLSQISTEAKALAAACQDGSINPDLLQGASFTVSNLGALESIHLNQRPQALPPTRPWAFPSPTTTALWMARRPPAFCRSCVQPSKTSTRCLSAKRRRRLWYMISSCWAAARPGTSRASGQATLG